MVTMSGYLQDAERDERDARNAGRAMDLIDAFLGFDHNDPYAPAPKLMLQTLKDWGNREGAMQPGGAVTALLENDLMGFVARLDRTVSMAGVRALLDYCLMELPSPSWGSAEAVQRWRTQEGR